METAAIRFAIDIPCLLRPAGPGAPLVVALHGRGEDATDMVERVGDRGADLSWALPRAPYPEEVGEPGAIAIAIGTAEATAKLRSIMSEFCLRDWGTGRALREG